MAQPLHILQGSYRVQLGSVAERRGGSRSETVEASLQKTEILA